MVISVQTCQPPKISRGDVKTRHGSWPQKVAEKCEVAPLRPKNPQSRPTGEFFGR